MWLAGIQADPFVENRLTAWRLNKRIASAMRPVEKRQVILRRNQELGFEFRRMEMSAAQKLSIDKPSALSAGIR
jgi:hypothetical protein